MELINLVFLPLITAAAVSFGATPFVIRVADKIGIVDDPKTHKHPSVIHTYPIPRGGGIAIFLGILVAAIIFLPIDKHLVGILAGGITLIILGILDDKFNLNPYKRLVIQFFVASLPIAAGIGIAFIKFPTLAAVLEKLPYLETLITNPVTGIIDLSVIKIPVNFFGDHSIWLLSDVFAILWIVTLMNFINIGASGLDGQLSGTVAIASAIIAVLSLRYSADIAQWPVIILATITSGAYLGFLPWHVYPQKIMPGFGGSTLAGFMLGVLSILSTTKVGTLLVVLAIPLVDTGLVVIRRVLAGKSPLWGDRGHFHHKLLDAGYSKRQVALFYWAITALLGMAALNLNAESKFYTILGVGVLLIGLILWLTNKKR